MPYLLSRDGAEFVVNPTVENMQGGAQVIASADGGFFIFWWDGSGQGGDPDLGVKGQRFGADGNPIGGEFLVNAPASGNQFASFVPTATGFLAIISDQGAAEAFGQYFNSSGSKVGTQFPLAATSPGVEDSPTATVLANGNTLFAWLKGGAVQTRLFDGAGQPLGGDVSIAPANNTALSVVGLTGGRYALSWTQGFDVKLQVFEANGTPLGDPVNINDIPDTSQNSPNLLALPNGGFVLTWAYGRSGNFDVMMQMFNATGQSTSDVVMVNSVRDGQQSAPDIALLPNGGFIISWTDSSRAWGDPYSTGVVAQVFNADGSKSGTNFGVNAQVIDAQSGGTIGVLADGRVVIAYTGYDGSFSGIRAQIFEPSDGPNDISLSATTVSEVAVENLVVATVSSSGSVNGVGNSTYIYLSDSAGGAFRLEGNRLVVADNGRLDYEVSSTVSVTLRVTDETGASYDETIVLNVADVVQESRYSAGPVLGGDLTSWVGIAALPSGGFVMVGTINDPWNGGGTLGIGVQLFDATGNKVGPIFQANTIEDNHQGSPSVAVLSDGGFVVTWQDLSTIAPDTSGSAVRGQRFDATGNRVGAEFVVNTTTSGDQAGASVTALVGGGFVVTWQDSSGAGGDAFPTSIKARVYDAAGAPVGGEFLVNTTVVNFQIGPRVTALSTGGFVIAWNDLSGVGGDADDAVKAQIFDAQGAKIGGEFLVNTITSGIQANGSLAGLAGGGFVAIFSDNSGQGGDASGAALKGQIFNAAGAKVDDEFLVNSFTEGNQFAASVQALQSGGFVVTWGSLASNGAALEMKAQIFDASGAKLGTEFQVDPADQTAGGFPVVTLLSDGRLAIAWPASGGVDFRFLMPEQPVSAQDDSATVAENEVLMGNLLGNDTAAAGAVLRVGAVNGQPANVGQVITLPSGARLTLNGDGTFTYNPNGAFAALTEGATTTDSFTYGLTNGTSATATITITGVDPRIGDAGSNNLTGTPGADTFRLEQGGNDSAFGLAGNDGFYFGTALDSSDVVDGGAGTDTVAAQGNYANLVLTGVTNVEVLLAASGADTRFGDTAGNSYDYNIATVEANVSGGATLTVIATGLLAGEDLVFNGAAETDGHFRVFAGQGTDQLTGGGGNDGFFFGADGNYASADRVNGGAGTDSIALRGNYAGANAVAFQDASFTGIEVLTLLSGHSNEFGGPINTNGFDYDVTLANGTIASGERLDVIGGNLRSNETLRVDARAELDGSVRIISGAADDTLFGSAGDDVLYGALGADALDGGAGSDTYLYRNVSESTASFADSLVFTAGDRIDLSLIDADSGSPGTNEAFAFIGSAAFSGVAGELRTFQSGAIRVVEGDVDGDGVADIVIAVDSPAPLMAGDFVL